MFEIILDFLKSDWIASAGLIVFATVLGAKLYDILRVSELHKALEEILKADTVLGSIKAYLKAVDKIIDATLPRKWPYRGIILKMNSSLLSSISIVAEEIITASNEAKKSKTVVGLMLGEKVKNSTKAQLFLILAFIINLSLYLFFELQLSRFALFIVSLGILGIHIDHKMIEYRVKHGLYGTNAFESRELINFMIAHSNKDDFNDSGGLKKIIPIPEVQEEKEQEFIIGGIKA